MEEYKIMHTINTPPQLLWALLGTAGGTARVFSTWLTQDPKPTGKMFAITLILNIFISGFTGYLGAVIGNLITTNDQWHVIFAGVFGYLGVNGLEFLSEIVKNKIQKTTDTI